MLRTQLNDELKNAMRRQDKQTVATLRLILAALKDRDIAARSEGSSEGIDEQQIHQMLQKMARQSQEAAETYQQAGRDDLAEKERGEVQVIERFLPRQLDEAETREAVDKAIADLGAESVKDMGRLMNRLRETYAGRMDFSKASAVAKDRLG